MQRRDGVIHSDAAYTFEGIEQHVGLSRCEVNKGVRDGFLHPFTRGRRLFFLGRELVQWLTGNCGHVGQSIDTEA